MNAEKKQWQEFHSLRSDQLGTVGADNWQLLVKHVRGRQLAVFKMGNCQILTICLFWSNLNIALNYIALHRHLNVVGQISDPIFSNIIFLFYMKESLS